jgi:hypothetical protein
MLGSRSHGDRSLSQSALLLGGRRLCWKQRCSPQLVVRPAFAVTQATLRSYGRCLPAAADKRGAGRKSGSTASVKRLFQGAGAAAYADKSVSTGSTSDSATIAATER